MTSQFFTQKLLDWYALHHRELPWRHKKNAYEVWLAEIIFQQTRIDQGLPYYHRFIETYPTVQDLSIAEEQAVLRLWQGLGYYTRARNLHKCARHIVQVYNGIFPSTVQELQKLPGIGPYTAAAIASIVFKEPVAAVDGNVYRVLARFFGLKKDITLTQCQKEFRRLAQSLLNKESPGDFNQALMEFGALQCTPKKPKCSTCIFSVDCMANRTNSQALFPVKTRKIRMRNRYFHYVVLRYKQRIYLKKRVAKDIWRGLYDFYLVEATQFCAFNTLDSPLLSEIKATKSIVKEQLPRYQHQLSHQRIHAVFLYVDVKGTSLPCLEGLNLVPFSYEAIQQLPKPKLIANFWSQFAKKELCNK